MRTRRSLLAIVAVIALMASVALVASAASGKSKAKFSASAPVALVGPGPGASTSIEVKRDRDGEGIKTIKVHTVNEMVLAGLLSVDAECKDNDDDGACTATGTILNGAGVLSIHTSDVKLKKVVPGPMIPGVDPLAEWSFALAETYSGKLSGKLSGAFIIGDLPDPTGAPVAVGEAKLNIKGTATYACVVPILAEPGFAPLPDLSYCEAGSPLPGTLFLPLVLSVVDKGKFEINPPVGVFVDSDHELVKMKGKLRVTVEANSLLDTLEGAIEITKGEAKFVDPTP